MSSELSSTLSESDSKKLLSSFNIPFASEVVTFSVTDAVSSASQMGFPVVVKLGGEKIAHKTERGLVRLRLNDEESVTAAATDLLAAATAEDGEVH